MNIEIKKNLGLHNCFKCARPLADSDFDHVGICVNQDPGIFADYVCPGCAFNGRYTIAINISASVDAALAELRGHLNEPPVPPPPRPRRRMHNGGTRDFRRFRRE